MKLFKKFFVTLLFLSIVFTMTGCAGWSRTEWRYKPDYLTDKASRMYGTGASEFGMPRREAYYESYMATPYHITTQLVLPVESYTHYVDAETGENLAITGRRDVYTNGGSYEIAPQYYYGGGKEDPNSNIRGSYIQGPPSPLPLLMKKGK